LRAACRDFVAGIKPGPEELVDRRRLGFDPEHEAKLLVSS